jgi:hypothetical protein
LGHAETIDKEIGTYLAWIKGESEKQSTVAIEENRATLSMIMEITGTRHIIPLAGLAKQVPTNNGQVLRSILIDPLISFLDKEKRIFIAADGDLTRMPFEVLPSKDAADKNSYLIDEYNIIYVSTGSDFLRFKAKPAGYVSLPVVAADPDYNLSIEKTEGKGYSYLPFQPLSNTRQEGIEVSSMLGVEPQ